MTILRFAFFLIPLLSSIAVGYLLLRRWGAVLEHTALDQNSAPSNKSGKFPLIIGCVAGLVTMAALAGPLTVHDRFYSHAAAVRIIVGTIISTLLIGLGTWAVVFWKSVQSLALVQDGDTDAAVRNLAGVQKRQGFIQFLLITAASVITVWLGVRFGTITPVGANNIELGQWAPLITAVYIIGATYCVMLLNGLNGAANVLLLVSAGLVYFSLHGTSEQVLAGLCAVIAGAALGSLRFNVRARGLLLGMDGTAVAGYLFAVLTVLSRQKTVAAALLVLPLLLIVILLGGFMLSMLERTMSIDPQDKTK